MFKEVKIGHCLSAAIDKNNHIYTVSYNLSDKGEKTGQILKLDYNLNIIKQHNINASFHLLEYKNFLITINHKSIEVFNLELKLLDKLEINESLTFAIINKEKLIITTVSGKVLFYKITTGEKKLNLEYIKEIKVTEFILWSLEESTKKDVYLVGSDSGDLFEINFHTNNIKNKNVSNLTNGISVTFIKNIEQQTYFSTYENVFRIKGNKIEKTKESKIEKIADFGVWRFVKHEDKMFAGSTTKFLVLDTNFNILLTKKLESHCYFVINTKEGVFFNSFYEKKIFKYI